MTSRIRQLRGLFVAVLLVLALPGIARAALQAGQLAVVVNDDDPQSVEIAAYYATARHIPAGNVIHVRIPQAQDALSAADFAPVRARILAATPAPVQAYALAWTRPWRVDCMSITSALSLGFDPAWCSRPPGCHQTRASPLFGYRTTAPFDDVGIRPSMMLAGSSVAEVHALIDRGLRADGSHPRGGIYLLVTDDVQRNTRLAAFARLSHMHFPGLAVQVIKANRLPPHDDVMFYFLGSPSVAGLDQLHFLPGAVADHLTSFGGMLTASPQMSILRWIEAGATASYGTVQEPCNFPQKFPDPVVLLHFYTHGDTLIEAYWKSVSSPGEGVFVGEPLARPWQ